MNKQRTGEQVSPTFEWLVDELAQRVTTLEIELAHWEHAHAACPDHADASQPTHRARQPGRRDTGAGGDADE